MSTGGERTRALVFGEVLVDRFESGEGAPREVPGGAPLNVATHLHRAGWQVSMLSRVGRDERAARLWALMESEGLPQDWIQEDPEAPTGWVSVWIGDGGDATFEIHEGVAWDRIELPEKLPEVDVLYYGSLAGRAPTSGATLAALQSREIPWKVFDVNLRQQHWTIERLVAGLEVATLAKMNEDELDVITERLGIPGAPASVVERFPSLRYLCVTRGSEGAELHPRGGLPVRRPAEVGPVVDTVGAGDALCAGLVRALVEGADPAVALEQGAKLAARVVAQEGAILSRE